MDKIERAELMHVYISSFEKPSKKATVLEYMCRKSKNGIYPIRPNAISDICKIVGIHIQSFKGYMKTFKKAGIIQYVDNYAGNNNGCYQISMEAMEVHRTEAMSTKESATVRRSNKRNGTVQVSG